MQEQTTSSWEKEGKWTWIDIPVTRTYTSTTCEGSNLGGIFPAATQRSQQIKASAADPPKRHSSAREGGKESRSSASLRENKKRRRTPLCIAVSIGFPGPNPNPNSQNVRLCKIRVSNPTLLAFVKISIYSHKLL